MTDGNTQIIWVCYGNPTRTTGRFHKECTRPRRFHYSRVDSRHVRFTNKGQINEWVEEYGEDSDFVRVRVRGLAPRASDAQFISQDLVFEAQRREVIPLSDEPLVAGLDVARGGADECVIRFRRGPDARSIPPIRLTGEQARDSMRLVSVCTDVLGRTYSGHRVAALFVDATGGSVGGPVADRLRQMGHSNVFDVQFGGFSPDPRMVNMRAYIWDRMRSWLPRGAIDATPDLETDLTGPGYGHDKADRLVLESKDHMRNVRRLPSPDLGDAAALTFAENVLARGADSGSFAPDDEEYDY
jgi:hypothetical protein